MNKEQFKALALSEHGRNLIEYLETLVRDVTDIRNIEEINEVEITARKRAAEIIEEELLNRLSLNRTTQVEETKSEWE